MSNENKKKKKKEEKRNPLEDVPAYLRDFVSSIALKEEPESPGTLRKKAQEKRKKALESKEPVDVKKMMTGNYQFTELDIMTLWNSFRIDFPEGKISEPQLMDVVKRVFPKCDADFVINNIFKAFDSEQTGKVVAQELLMCFSMSMKGTVEDKLHWTFRLYDQDGSGEIDPDEMELIFTKFCKICESTEVDQTRKQRRELEAKRLAEKIKMEKKAALEAKRQHEELLNGKQKKIVLLSEKSKRIHPDLYPKKRKTWGKKKPTPKPVLLSTESVKEAAKKPENSDKVQILSMIADELSDPARDCKKFDQSKRARELFNALDDDGNGFLTEDEFITGCMSDEAFVKVLDEFSADFIWGYSNE